MCCFRHSWHPLIPSQPQLAACNRPRARRQVVVVRALQVACVAAVVTAVISARALGDAVQHQHVAWRGTDSCCLGCVCCVGGSACCASIMQQAASCWLAAQHASGSAAPDAAAGAWVGCRPRLLHRQHTWRQWQRPGCAALLRVRAGNKQCLLSRSSLPALPRANCSRPLLCADSTGNRQHGVSVGTSHDQASACAHLEQLLLQHGEVAAAACGCGALLRCHCGRSHRRQLPPECRPRGARVTADARCCLATLCSCDLHARAHVRGVCACVRPCQVTCPHFWVAFYTQHTRWLSSNCRRGSAWMTRSR